MLLPYNTIKENLKKIASIVEKTQCQNYINYNDFIETCNKRWDIIENSNKDRQYDTYKKDRRYTTEIEKLQGYVEKTLQKCEKINSYSETNNAIVANKAKKAIVAKYSIVYNELFHNLCNETNVEKQVQYEKDIEDLQKKTQEICSVVDTKAFEKQIKSASDVEQIKTLIINYK